MATQVPSDFEPGNIQKKPVRSLRGWLVLAIAVLAGLGAAYLAVMTLKNREHAALERILSLQEKDTVRAVVPTHDIPAGTILDLSMVAARSIPADTAPADIITPEDFDRFGGHRVNVPLMQGRPILQSYLSGRRTLADLIDPQKLAMTFTVDNVSTLEGMLQPGDHIDVLWFFTGGNESQPPRPVIPEGLAEGSMPVSLQGSSGFTGPGEGWTGPRIFRARPANAGEQLPRETVRYIEHDLKIIATGTRTVADDSAANLNNDPAQSGPVTSFQTVTVELSPTQIQKLQLAQKLGQLTLVLRGHGSQVSVPAKAYTVRDILGMPERSRGPIYAADTIEYIIGQTQGGLQTTTQLQGLRRIAGEMFARRRASVTNPASQMANSPERPTPIDRLLPPVDQYRDQYRQ